MATFRLDMLIPVLALLQYSAALHAFARKHAAVLATLISTSELELQRLSDLIAQLAAADLAWAKAVSDLTIALGARDNAFGLLLPTYTQIRNVMQIEADTNAKALEIRTALKGCPPPARLFASEAPEVLARLLERASTHSAAFAAAGVNPALIGQLSAQTQVLTDAIAIVGVAEPERNQTSSLREQARESLVIQARRVERYLKTALTSKEDRAAIKSIRTNNLPVIARKTTPKPSEPTS